MTDEEIARLKVLASSVNPADAYTADVDRSHDVAEVLRTFAPVLGELERVTAERDALRAEVEQLRERMESTKEECPACEGFGYGGGLNGSDRCYVCRGRGVVLS